MEKYARLDIYFYKRSECTEAVMKMKTSRHLDLCEKDILVEYLWKEGAIWDTLHYQNGVIKGSEDIRLDPVR